MTYQESQNLLLESFFNRYETKPAFASSVEFIISSQCNQNCEYCYLFKHRKEMYPANADCGKNVLKNLPLLLEWLEEKKVPYNTYDIFSGEFFALPYWEEVFQIFYDFHKSHNIGKRTLSIPTNGTFCQTKEGIEKVEKWIEKFDKIKIDVFLSLSIDGPEWLEKRERPTNNSTSNTSDEFYDNIFNFAKKNHYSFHPMITKNFVKNYKEHYDWWMDKIKEYDLKMIHNNGFIYNIPMFLEVRDPNQWDAESIENYKKLLWYIAEKDLKELYNNDLNELANRILNDFGGDKDATNTFNLYTNVQPYLLSLPHIQNRLPCSIQKGPVFRVGDLAYVPCHRTCYPNLIYGYLIIDEETNKITGFKANNAMLALKIKTLNPNRSFLKCSDCEIKQFCMKGCLGSQLENAKELFAAQEEICELFKAKFTTIHNICKHYNLYEIIQNNLFVSDQRKDEIEYAKSVLERLLPDNN